MHTRLTKNQTKFQCNLYLSMDFLTVFSFHFPIVFNHISVICTAPCIRIYKRSYDFMRNQRTNKKKQISYFLATCFCSGNWEKLTKIEDHKKKSLRKKKQTKNLMKKRELSNIEEAGWKEGRRNEKKTMKEQNKTF